VRGHAIQKAWHLSNQDALAWLLDEAKGLGLSIGFAAIAAVAFFAVVRWQPRWWWVWGAASFTALTATLVFLFPVLIAPLFNRFTPLADRDLAARIESLAESAGVNINRVLVADASKRSTAENAYVAGLGATKQVVLYDTLIEGNEEPETLFVVAHELGHESERHVLKGLGVSAVGLFVGFAVLAWLAGRGPFLRWAGAASVADLRILPALLLFAVAAGLVAQPIQNAISRRFEARADAIAFRLTGDPEPAIKAFRSLAISNISDLRPPAVVEWMFYSHPPIADRIEAARAAGTSKP
jgi:STE24 endopeptidase